VSVAHAANAILSGLDALELAALDAAAQEIQLARGAVLEEAGDGSPFVYFPLAGVLSLVGTTLGGASVEVAVVGNEGAAGMTAVLGTSSLPFRIMSQLPGRALRVPTDVVSKGLRDCGVFHDRMMHYTQTIIVQVAQSAICNRFHNAKQRLARWLLMTADRAHATELPLTHEFIACMVGGPRSAVTEAAAALRASGAIAYRRGVVTIRSRATLTVQACECYAVLGRSGG
jgi:CRP-like cAMP-binding protein